MGDRGLVADYFRFFTSAANVPTLPAGFYARGGGATWCANYNRRPKLEEVAITQRGRGDGPWWPIRAELTGNCLTQDEFAGLRRPS